MINIPAHWQTCHENQTVLKIVLELWWRTALLISHSGLQSIRVLVRLPFICSRRDVRLTWFVDTKSPSFIITHRNNMTLHTFSSLYKVKVMDLYTLYNIHSLLIRCANPNQVSQKNATLTMVFCIHLLLERCSVLSYIGEPFHFPQYNIHCSWSNEHLFKATDDLNPSEQSESSYHDNTPSHAIIIRWNYSTRQKKLASPSVAPYIERFRRKMIPPP